MCGPDGDSNLSDVGLFLRTELTKNRRHGKFLLTQAIIASVGSLVAAVIALAHAFDLDLQLIIIFVIPAAITAVWATLRIVRNREAVVELKTIRWLLKSVHRETAERMAKEVAWGEPQKESRIRRQKKKRGSESEPESKPR
jgi:hypothetical protein